MKKIELKPNKVSQKTFEFYSTSDVHLFKIDWGTEGTLFYMGYGNARGRYSLHELNAYPTENEMLKALEELAEDLGKEEN